VNGLAHSPVALGVLPTGTANVWAQEIGLPVPRLLSADPNPLLTCIKQLAADETRTMDLGRLNGRYFMLYGSVGFDAHIVREMDQQPDMKARLGGMAYLVAGAVAAWNFIGTRALIVVDGKKLRRRIWAVMAANTQLYGGVMRIAADARADDGLLDVVVVEGHGPVATLRHFAGFLLQGYWADPQVELIRCRSVEVFPHHPLPVQVDGDSVGSTPARIEAVPRALRVLLPRGAALPIFTESSIPASDPH
jgi:diacylglycerol kinase family enzyme